jgi:Tol biopolymer transport system component
MRPCRRSSCRRGSRRAAIVAAAVLSLATRAVGQATTRVSVDSSGAEGDGGAWTASISADGRFVAFNSTSRHLVAGDGNDRSDVFVHDRLLGTTERVSVDSNGVEGDSDSYGPSISADGRFVAFTSIATNLVGNDGNGYPDVFVRDRASGTTERISVDPAGGDGDLGSSRSSISADGNYVAFESFASNLVAGDANHWPDVFVRDRAAGTSRIVSVDSAGAQGDGYSWSASISADGLVVAFESQARNLVAGETNTHWDVFVHDVTTGITERVSSSSSGGESDAECRRPSISGDGRFVAFHADASNLVSNDSNDATDVFVRDRANATTERASEGPDGLEANGASLGASISADGAAVAFQSYASNLLVADTNGKSDVFVRDRATGVVQRVSVDSAGADGDDDSEAPSISADGWLAAFGSYARNLVANDGNSDADIFVHERRGIHASWTNYGSGFPGTKGVPPLAPEADPVLGTAITVDVGNSAGVFTVGLLFVGLQRAQVHSGWGGDLLLVPSITLVIGLAPSGASLDGELPLDEELCGLAIDLQAIELDRGAAKGVSFTPGLELLLGH